MAGFFGSREGVMLSSQQFKAQLNRVYRWYTVGLVVFVLILAVLERMGLPRLWIGTAFLLATIGLYAGIGIMSRTTDAGEYYVAGRRVPAVYNGMATGADWMSAASFIGLAGTLYLTGYSGLAFIMGWTGGYCLVALVLAPYLRKFGQFTIPDFLGERYGGKLPRLIGVGAAILCSFTYLVAQIYGVGLITSYLTGIAFELGIFLGLGGILVCSFLGGMRAVTWTQVAQYIILVVAYLIPVVWLSVKQTGVPVPQLVYGLQLEKVSAKEKELAADPKEVQVRELFRQRSEALSGKLAHPAEALAPTNWPPPSAWSSSKGAMPRWRKSPRRPRPWPPCPRMKQPPSRPGRPPRQRPRSRPSRSTACPPMRRSFRATPRARPGSRRPMTPRAAISWPWCSASWWERPPCRTS